MTLKISKSNRTPMFRRHSLSRLSLTLLACVVIIVVLSRSSSSSSSSSRHGDLVSSNTRSATKGLVTPALTPRKIRVPYEVADTIHDTVLYYMLPNDDNTKGILFFFHGCNHSGQDTFLLPEDRIIALAALNRGLAVVSLTSQDRSSGCWSSRDVKLIHEHNVADKGIQKMGLSLDLPRMGIGVSSGGSFLFFIYKHLKLKSMASYVSPQSFSDDELSMHPVGSALPATMFVHMPRDKKTASRVETSYKRLKEAGIPSAVIAISPHPFTPEVCARRLPELGDLRCNDLFREIEKQNDPPLLDPRDYTVLESKRQTSWNTVLAPFDKYSSKQDPTTSSSNLLPPTSFSGHSWLYAAVEEEIAVAYGRHETTAERRSEVLDFLMKHAGLDVDINK